MQAFAVFPRFSAILEHRRQHVHVLAIVSWITDNLVSAERDLTWLAVLPVV